MYASREGTFEIDAASRSSVSTKIMLGRPAACFAPRSISPGARKPRAPGKPRTAARPYPPCSRHGPPHAVLSVEGLLVTEPDQELPSLLFEDAPVLLRE